jgi:tRNA G18 (ribose-2'-O)-methylase SpoU
VIKRKRLLDSANPSGLFAAVKSFGEPVDLGPGRMVNRRVVSAFGISGPIVDPRSCSPFLRRAVTSSAGTVFSVSIIELDNLASALRELRMREIRCIAAHPSAKNNPISKASLVGDCCLVMGSEGPGISRETLEQCDELVSIPMHSQVDSLNVASASAIFLYEAVRQRKEGL